MDMFTILLKSASFVFLIVLGYLLKRSRFFGPKDYAVPMKLVLNVTLPASVITSYASYQFDLSLLLCTLIGFGMNWLLLGLAWVFSRNRPRPSRTVWLNSLPGYNIGAFALPFVQSFFPASGVVACCLFDSGSALMCTGGTYAISSALLGDKGSLSLKVIGKKLASSLPFMTYFTMLIVSVIGIPVPQALLTFISPMAAANPFLAMIMVGMMFDLDLDREALKDVRGMIVIRVITSVAAALCFYFLLPFPDEIRKALCIAIMAPVSVTSTALAEKAGGNPAEAACVNSLCILISVTCIVILLAVFGTL